MTTETDFPAFVAERFGGVLARGSHEPDGAACFHEAFNVWQGRPWSATTTGTLNLIGLNDAPWSTDQARTAAMLPLGPLVLDWPTWTPERRQAWAKAVAEGVIRRILPPTRDADPLTVLGFDEALTPAEVRRIRVAYALGYRRAWHEAARAGVLGLVIAAISGAALAIAILAASNALAATPRSAALPSNPVADARSIGAPLPVPAALIGPEAPRNVSGPLSSSAGVSRGSATWYDDGPGLYAAVHSWRWGDKPYTVRVCRQDQPTRCVDVVVRDFCACGKGHVIDLSPKAFARLAPLWAGVVPVTVRGASGAGPVPTPPATDP